jgi:hypothetical protein
MPIKNQAITLTYVAWDTAANVGKTGDAANHTIRAVGDGTEFTPGGGTPTVPVQVDSTNLKGVYKIALAASEMNYNCIALGGSSSTAGIVIYPVQIFTDQGTMPTAAPNAAGGFLTVGSGSGQLNPSAGNMGLVPNDSFVIQAGTAQAGAAGSITLASGASATDNLYVGQTVKIISGTGSGQVRVVSGYVGSTKVATVGRVWITNPDNTSLYVVQAIQSPLLDPSLRVSLGTAGLDAITVETGINARQALSPILAAAAGALSGATTSTVAIAAAGNPSTNRISATVDGSGNRTAITLNLPT